MDGRFGLRTVAVGFALMFGMAPTESAFAKDPPSTLQTLDPDHDGTVDLNEAKTAAAALFDRLDRDHDGTLDGRELKHRIDAKALAAADPDHDGTLDKAEYLALVERLFASADPGHDGTLDAKELRSPAGRTLIRLTK
jgi:Ca2+-binding EF-hand superfamily protein